MNRRSRAADPPDPDSVTVAEPSVLDSVADDSEAPRRSNLPVWLLGFAFVGIAVAVNWPYQYVRLSGAPAGTLNSVVDFGSTAATYPRLGGFPYRYWISYAADREPSAISAQRFSALALFYDVLIAAAVCGVFVADFWRRRNRFGGRRSKSSRSISIADLMLVTLLLACPFAAWQALSSRFRGVIALQQKVVVAGGGVEVTAWGPWWSKSILPDSVARKLVRLHGIRLDAATPELTNELIRQPLLRTLRVGGSSVTPELIARVPALPHLTDLRIAGSQLSIAQFEMIGRCERLQTLSLMRTNLNVDSLALIEDLPNLERLNTIHSDLPLASVGAAKFSRTLVELNVGHPAPGESDELEISSWPELRKLTINEFDSQANAVPLPVRLADLPQLYSVQIDAFQNVAVEIDNAPELTTLEDLSHEWLARIGRGGRVSGALWVSKLKLTNAPKLKKVHLFAGDLNELRLVGVPKLDNFGIGAFYRTYSAATYAPKLSPTAATAIVEGLGRSEGPKMVDLDAVPLGGVDLSPLSANSGILELLLSYSNTDASQWASLAGLKQLTRLEVKGNPIDNDQIGTLLKTFPNLETFACSPGAVPSGLSNRQSFVFRDESTNLVLRDHPRLTNLELDLSNLWGVDQVSIRNMPKLRYSLDIDSVAELEIENSPRISGVSIQGYYPPTAELSGLNELLHFAVGGPGVTDDVLTAIAGSRNLTSLTLAYPQISEAALAGIGDFEYLGDLHLPGCAVTDEVIAQWPRFTGLASLDLSDTKVTIEGLRRLIPATVFLRELAIGRTSIDASELTLIGGQDELIKLDVSGVGITPAVLSQVLQKGRLKYLDLSDTNADASVLDAIMRSASSLNYLGLRNCQVDNQTLSLLAGKYPEMIFDLSGSDVASELEAELISSRRLATVSEWRQHAMIQNARMSGYVGSRIQDYSVYEDPFPARIDVSVFSPRAVGVESTAGAGFGASGLPPGTQVFSSGTTSSGTTIWSVTATPPVAGLSMPSASPAFSLGYLLGRLVGGDVGRGQPAQAANDQDVEIEFDSADALSGLEDSDELQ